MAEMKVLLVGSDKIYAIENFYVRYLREQGADVLHFPAQSRFYEHYQKSPANKLLFRAGLSTIYRRLNAMFKGHVTTFNPDVIWIFKGMEIYPKTLEWAKGQGSKLVNYNPDNPFLFSGKGSGNANITGSIGLYNLHFTYNQHVKKEIESKYHIPTKILPFAFDVPEEVYRNSLDQAEIRKVCFLGNPDRFRGSFITQLAEAGVQIDVYGNFWNKFVNHPNISVNGPVYGNEIWFKLRQYRVQLNLMRPHNPDSHNMRTFEVAGIGGIQVAPETTDHISYFAPDREIFLFQDIETCILQIKRLLSLADVDAEKIRLQVRSKSLNSGYSYKARAAQALTEMQLLLVRNDFKPITEEHIKNA